MPERSLISVVNAIVPAPDHISDSSLLRRFTDEGDHAAFELLLRRHADVVWAACKGILRNDADAEDAFQATFLALTRRAKAVVAELTAAGWLHRVAVNAALKRLAARRPDTSIPHDIIDRRMTQSFDDYDILHQELNRLRDRDRLPVVLCDLEGHTREAAAAILGWPVGTVNGRLSRARDRLRERLLKRGVAAPAALISMTVPHAILARAAALALNPSVVPESISHLATGALTAMTATKFKLTAALAAGVLLTAGMGTMVAFAPQGPGKTDGESPVKSPASVSADTKLKRQATKLESGRIVLFPELAKDFPIKDEDWQKVIDGLAIPGEIPLEDGVRRIQLEQYRATVDAVNLEFQVTLSDQWDVSFLNQYRLDLDQLAKGMKTFSPPKDVSIRILKARLTFAYHLEDLVYKRVHIARNLRFQQLFQTRAMRHAFELDLAAAEDAKSP